jgi:hypothetical protein
MSILRIALMMMHSTATAAAVTGSSSLDQPIGPWDPTSEKQVLLTKKSVLPPLISVKVHFFFLNFKTGQNISLNF